MPLFDLGKDVFLASLPERSRPKETFFKEYGVTDVKCGFLGNFTVVLIKAKNGTDSLGIAKRNPDDKESSSVGISIACVRALRDFHGQDPKYARQYPTSKRKAAQARANSIVDSIYGLDY